MMRKKHLLLLMIAILLIGVFVGRAIGGVSPEPGSQDDPLVTKSYVDTYLERKYNEMTSEIDSLEKKIKDLETKVSKLKENQKPITLYLNKKEAYIGNEKHNLDAAPFEINGRTLVPFRFIGEALGAEVDYDSKTKKVSYKLGSKLIELKINSKEIIVDNNKFTMDEAAKLVDGRTFVPLRVVSEQLGYQVEWEGSEKKILIKP